MPTRGICQSSIDHRHNKSLGPGVADRPPLETAVEYVALGLAVLPLCGPRHCCSHPGKVPVDLRTGRHLGGWQTRRVPTLAEVEAWLSLPLGLRANLGCVMGRASGVVGVDVDGPEGEEGLRELSGGHLPDTWEYQTRPGRRRLIYALPEGVRIPSTRPRPKLEILSDGVQAVLPPSLHPLGHRYTWVPGRDPWTFGPPAPAPGWLQALGNRPETVPAPPEGWRALVTGPIPEGMRNITLTRLAGYLLRRGVDPYVALELLEAWAATRCRPPLDPVEVRRTVNSVARAEVRRRRKGGEGLGGS